jgi:hypothetical protein
VVEYLDAPQEIEQARKRQRATASFHTSRTAPLIRCASATCRTRPASRARSSRMAIAGRSWRRGGTLASATLMWTIDSCLAQPPSSRGGVHMPIMQRNPTWIAAVIALGGVLGWSGIVRAQELTAPDRPATRRSLSPTRRATSPRRS